jgi:putative heme-binding domain-containing protein
MLPPRRIPFRPLALLAAVLSAAPTAYPQRGDNPDTRLLPAAESRARFRLPPGFGIQLVAAEPDLQKPFNLAFDAAGRVWVTGSALYPWPARRDALGDPIASFRKNWDDNNLAFRAAATPPVPADYGTDTVRVLSDFDPATGRARHVVTFADGLNIPIGILPLPRPPDARGDSALVFSIPAIWRLTDTDGDGRADRREKLYDGFGFKDTHGMSSSYWLWFDGWVYGTHGYANVSEVRDRAGRTTVVTSGATYRFRPDGSEFQIHVRGQTNPYGLAFDPRGDLYTADSHSKPVYLLVPGGSYEGIGIGREHDGLGYGPPITTDDHGSSAIAGLAHYSAPQFPAEFRDNLFNRNPVTRRINRTRLEWRGSTPLAARQPDFLASDDPAFRPVQVKLGPDGALWVADFYNPIIGHYEAPLTHPARDRTHGRIWRIVWRGLDGTAPPSVLPPLAARTLPQLVAALADANLVVRSLAAGELMARPAAAEAAPALRAAARRLVAGDAPEADATPALAYFHLLARLGHADDALLESALARLDSEVAVAALRVLAERPSPPPAFLRSALADLPTRTGNLHTWRAAAPVLARESAPWSTDLLLGLLLAAPNYDTQLAYALRLALKTHLRRATAADFARLLEPAPKYSAAADLALAEICLAVPTPAAAEFLLGHLQRTNFSGARTGEFARHAVQQLPPERFSALPPVIAALAAAPRAQRLAFAEGLAAVAAPPARPLPAEVHDWMERELLAALRDRDGTLVLRAIAALKPLPSPEVTSALRALAAATGTRDPQRIAALRALDPRAAATGELAVAALVRDDASVGLRRAAAEVLGTTASTAAARAALAGAFATAPADLAVALATALAKSDAGAAELLALAAAGRVRPQLLRHRHVELAIAQRPAGLHARAAQLTRDLPDEDARLDAVIARRLAAAGTHRSDLARGAALFTQHCAACHRFRDSGGTVGPSLDGSGARTVARLVEDILDPSRNIDPAFRLTSLTLTSGETRSGLNHRPGSGQHTLTDPTTGQDVAIPTADVAGVAASPISAMPAAFETLLPPGELLDLIEFLRTPATR